MLGYDAQGAVVTLRKGIERDRLPRRRSARQEPSAVSCYHKDLEPFMARGRELGGARREGHRTRRAALEGDRGRQAHHAARAAFAPRPHCERLRPRDRPGDRRAYVRWVVYTPFATPETTGLPVAPVPGGPVADVSRGRPSAHIMINPARSAAPAPAKPCEIRGRESLLNCVSHVEERLPSPALQSHHGHADLPRGGADGHRLEAPARVERPPRARRLRAVPGPARISASCNWQDLPFDVRSPRRGRAHARAHRSFGTAAAPRRQRL